ncbi:predicted protein [Chaetoceros tenuissimus]|uniref:TLC domain-containing protein n=1 Tax=Chaetoceros tenuissimus TaxID=426638 RepID=A0AAD3H9T0_9STRA|nr:predicted protein [Chaetoceros tenuissimus]
MKVSNLLINTTVFQATSAALGANTSVSLQPYSSTPLLAKSETFSGKTHTSAIGDATFADPTSYDGHPITDVVDDGFTYAAAAANGHQTISNAWLNASSLTMDTTHGIAIYETCANYVHVDDTFAVTVLGLSDVSPAVDTDTDRHEENVTATDTQETAADATDALAIDLVFGDASSTAADDADFYEAGVDDYPQETDADATKTTTSDNELFILLIGILGTAFYSYMRPTPESARDFVWSKQNCFSSLFILTTTIFFLASHIVVDGLAAVLEMLKRGLIVYLLCLAMESLILALCKLLHLNMKYPYVLCHFSLGVLSFVAYIWGYYNMEYQHYIPFVKSIMFSYYEYTMFFIAIRPELFPKKFSMFYCIHHGFAFLFLGSWNLIKEQQWEQYMVTSAAIWLSSDVGLYVKNSYKSIYGETAFYKKATKVVFFIERIQRITAYVVGAMEFTEASTEYFHYVVFTCMIGIDIFDLYSQLVSMGVIGAGSRENAN